ncbi:hypothetical protein [Tabrizicola sp.]|uniref:hypothetical protein n=1 Tax=Tabrizicola sp. TaxID=2005166 RepID=UPI002FDD9E6E
MDERLACPRGKVNLCRTPEAEIPEGLAAPAEAGSLGALSRDRPEARRRQEQSTTGQ